MAFDTKFVNHFINPNLGIEIFVEKEREVDFEIGGEAPAAHC